MRLISLLIFLFFSTAVAQNNLSDVELLRGKKLLERVTGKKWAGDHPIVLQVANLIKSGQIKEAAQVATQHPDFLNLTVKQIALKMSTIEESISTPFNDFAASFVGVVRDDRDIRELLTGDFYYRPADGDPTTVSLEILSSNRRYEDLERSRANLQEKLVRVEGQRLLTGDKVTTNNPDPAGVLTSRTFLSNFTQAGTNRRAVEYAFRAFMCTPLEVWADANAPDLRIGRDIDRFPAGSHLKFQTSCKACHTVMDGFRGAFARWDFADDFAVNASLNGSGKVQAQADRNGVLRKMNKNESVYPGGYVMTDDSWVNYATLGSNAARFGWRGATIGRGVKGMGAIIANSKRFSQCMAKRTFEAICQKTLNDTTHANLMADLGNYLESNQYNLETLVHEIVTRAECL